MKITVYTAHCGNRDPQRPMFTKTFIGEGIFRSPVMEAKIYKVLAHEFVDADYSIWLDYNIDLKVSPEIIVKEFLGDAHIGVFKHPYRNSIMQEFDVLTSDPRFTKDIWLQERLKAQREHYKALFVDILNLWECNFIVRKHCLETEVFNLYWWGEICRWQYRDQVSFPVVAYMLDEHVQIKTTEGNIRNHPLFNYIWHD